MDRVAVVTGASRGLGATFARVFSEEGFSVVLGARDLGAIEKLAASADLRARYGAAARRRAVEKFSADAIGQQTVDLYRRLIGAGPA